jgi:threonine dehydratase
VGVPVWLKLECLQLTGSFKARNAFSFLLGAQVPDAGVVALSGGNFGLAMAYAARQLGYPITIFVPEAAGKAKIEGIRRLGANVEVVSGPMKDLFTACDRHIAETGALPAHPYDQPEVVAGAGTCGLEFDEQCPQLDTVLVAVGGGGLIGGIATWFDDRTRIVAVETEGTPTLNRALAAGEPVEIEPSGVAVSALGAPVIGEIPWNVAKSTVQDTLLVTDEHALSAQRRLWDTAKIVAEPGGAVAFAALSAGAYIPEQDERVGVVICGGNTNPATVLGP